MQTFIERPRQAIAVRWNGTNEALLDIAWLLSYAKLRPWREFHDQKAIPGAYVGFLGTLYLSQSHDSPPLFVVPLDTWLVLGKSGEVSVKRRSEMVEYWQECEGDWRFHLLRDRDIGGKG